ncbi:6177_t:CDS:2 [Entrophospora sp. SA101]|nr:6177_t:CDS:2 [Entrophospora sp. SA101]
MSQAFSSLTHSFTAYSSSSTLPLANDDNKNLSNKSKKLTYNFAQQQQPDEEKI